MPSELGVAVPTARRDALPQDFGLAVYRIERILGSGGFGIVYLARHMELDHQVAIKEYLPTECAVREGFAVHIKGDEYRAAFEEGLSRFRDEARRLVELDDHPAIVSCRDFFRANGTAYLVMDYTEGEPLTDVLRTRETDGRPFDQSDLLNVIVPLLEGLVQVHAAGIIHRDIKPGNILIRKMDGQPILLDFGAAKQGVAELTKSMAPFTEGYAAFEQVGNGKLGPWTDIYAVGAVMWRMVAGGSPPWEPPNPLKVESRARAQLRGTVDPLPAASVLGKGRFSTGVLAVVEECLRLQEVERIQSCGELLRVLHGYESTSANGESVPRDYQEAAVWYRKAAQQGHATAQFKLGQMYEFGSGVPRSHREAVAWYRKAAEQGDAWAQYNLGDMYARGVGQDFVEAIKWYREAAEQGHASAQFKLGSVYEWGSLGVSQDDAEAVAWWRRAADQGHASAQLKLGLMYARGGDGVPEDHEEAVAWFQEAADQQHPSAQYELGLMYRFGKGVPKDHGEALAWYRRAADQGYAKAQFKLGQVHRYGSYGVPEDYQEAAAWFRKAADEQHARAQYELGAMYASGKGTPQDDAEAVSWWRKAANNKYAEAQYLLGSLHEHGGRGVPEDHQEAVAWYRRAADRRHAEAEFKLGAMYASGKGTLQDDAEAVSWWQRAAYHEHAEAQYLLGSLHERGGRGVPEDHQEAVAWYRRAADQQHAEAEFKLGAMYASGKGTLQDDAEAVAWWRRAADQGHAQAQYSLGTMYASGTGVSQDDVRAFAWLGVAIEQGNERASQLRARVCERMTPEQIDEAGKLRHSLIPQMQFSFFDEP